MTESRVALGDRLYRLERGWARNGPDVPLSGLSAVVVGADGLVHVLRRERPFLLSLGEDGTVVSRADQLDVTDGHGLFPATDGSLWLADRDGHAVMRVTRDGSVLYALGGASTPAPFGPLGHPTRAVVAPDGEVYIADGYADAVIRRYSPDGHLIGEWGRPGLGPGAFRTPHSLWATERLVYVADRDNDRIQVFDREGGLIAVWDDFVKPMDLFVDGDGRVYVTEEVPRLSVWSETGTLLGRCRLPSLQCHGITGDASGRIYVAEVRASLVTRLTPAVA